MSPIQCARRLARIPLPVLLGLAVLSACTQPPPTVEAGKLVSMLYQAKTTDGVLVDANPDDGPIVFVVGAGKLQPLVEEKLIGLPLDEERTFSVKDAYGTHDPSNTGSLPLQAIPDNAKVGDELQMVDGLTSKIKEIRPDVVILDLNHPLAGAEIVFTVKIVKIADAEEADAG